MKRLKFPRKQISTYYAEFDTNYGFCAVMVNCYDNIN